MNKKTVILLADLPILNPKIVKPFQDLSIEYSIYLNSLLFTNWMEIVNSLGTDLNPFILLSEKDEEYIPKSFIPDNFNNIFYKSTRLENVQEDLIKIPAINGSKVLIIFYNSIGLKQSDIDRIFNLVHSEETTLVIGKSKRNKVILTCSYEVDKDLISPLFSTKRNFLNYLNYISSKDIFIHSLEGYFSIDDFEDIKKLYIELSKKESLSYCSQKMHESFNDLFVEYKELLNE
jgi:hypothetical protein